MEEMLTAVLEKHSSRGSSMCKGPAAGACLPGWCEEDRWIQIVTGACWLLGEPPGQEKGRPLGPGRGCSVWGWCWWLQGGQQGSGRTGGFWVCLGLFPTAWMAPRSGVPISGDEGHRRHPSGGGGSCVLCTRRVRDAGEGPSRVTGGGWDLDLGTIGQEAYGKTAEGQRGRGEEGVGAGPRATPGTGG